MPILATAEGIREQITGGWTWLSHLTLTLSFANDLLLAESTFLHNRLLLRRSSILKRKYLREAGHYKSPDVVYGGYSMYFHVKMATVVACYRIVDPQPKPSAFGCGVGKPFTDFESRHFVGSGEVVI